MSYNNLAIGFPHTKHCVRAILLPVSTTQWVYYTSFHPVMIGNFFLIYSPPKKLGVLEILPNTELQVLQKYATDVTKRVPLRYHLLFWLHLYPRFIAYLDILLLNVCFIVWFFVDNSKELLSEWRNSRRLGSIAIDFVSRIGIYSLSPIIQ